MRHFFPASEHWAEQAVVFADVVPGVHLSLTAASDDAPRELYQCILHGTEELVLRSDGTVVLARVVLLVTKKRGVMGLFTDSQALRAKVIEPDERVCCGHGKR